MEFRKETPTALELAFARLEQLPFIEKVSRKPPPADLREGRLFGLRAGGNEFLVRAMHLTSFLGAGQLAQILTLARQFQAADREPLLLIARYISAPAAEHLIANHVSFFDAVGNCHLELGGRYNWTRIGIRDRPTPRPKIGRDRVEIQLLLQFASEPASFRWTVRRVAKGAGVSKSAAALMLKRLDPKGLAKVDEMFQSQIIDAEHFRTAMVGYGRAVRPKILIGRFRPPTKSSLNDVITALQQLPRGDAGIFAVTGRAAAQILRNQGPIDEFSLFVENWHYTLFQLRLEPDQKGPLVFFRPFGSVVFGKIVEGVVIAPIPLIIAELLTSKDPRDQKLAVAMQNDYLKEKTE